MAQTMAPITPEDLRKMQSALNSSIDSYVATVSAQKQISAEEQTQAMKSIVTATNVLSDAIANPVDVVMNFPLQFSACTAFRIVLELKILEAIGEGASLQELADKTGAQAQLLFRVLRTLVSARMLKEPEEKVYQHTSFSRWYLNPPFSAWGKTCFDTLLPIFREIPGSVAKNGYKDPSDLSTNPTYQLYGSLFWEQLAQDPRREADFALAMKAQDFAPPSTWPQFPIQEGATGFSSDPEAVFIVDVGGGTGQYLIRMHETNPSLPGHSVCQDLPTVIDSISQETQDANNFRVMKHDFFKPQPVIGARYYHLRGIMHDWPDASCVEILRQLRPAFKPGYSKLLVQSMVYPEMDCTYHEAMFDLLMWTLCGRERTEREFKELLAKAGFKFIRMIKAEVGLYSVMEAELDDQDGTSTV